MYVSFYYILAVKIVISLFRLMTTLHNVVDYHILYETFVFL